MNWLPDRAAALTQLDGFVAAAGRAYANTRNHDDGSARANVSLLSPWLHAGVIGEDEVLRAVLAAHSASAADKFISEVFWRIYFKGYLEQHPSIWSDYTRQRDAALAALDSNSGRAKAYDEAIAGRTGIAAFDHWASELTHTGYLHNHARMWFASIWIFTLKLDWTLGADFFLRHLLDADAASNTLSWRWVGGLHTKGKTYLARPDNIATSTQGHPRGPLEAQGLAREALALEDARDHPREALAFAPPPLPLDFAEPYALLLHDEAAHHLPLDLPRPPALIIGAARPAARSPGAIGTKARDFAQGAVRSGMKDASAAFGCPAEDLPEGAPLAELLGKAKLGRVVCGHLPVGWTRDDLWPHLAALEQKGSLIQFLGVLERLSWPHAKAGFFAVKKAIGPVLSKAGIVVQQ